MNRAERKNGWNDPVAEDEWGEDPFAEPPPPQAEEEDDETLAEHLLPADKLAFAINDAASASWVVRKIVEARARQERIKAWAAAELKAARREEEFFLRRFGPELEAWAAENLHGQKKTLRLPDGTLGYRRKGLLLNIEDKEATLEWCRGNLPEAVRVREDVLKTPLNEWVKETGEVPPGCEIKPGGDEFYVR
jgi:phage host-nuclease inhibitor protein Gam